MKIKKELCTILKIDQEDTQTNDRLYVSRNAGRGLTSIEDFVDTSMKGIENFIKRAKKTN